MYVFNGAATFQPWILVEKASSLKHIPALQWGHDFSAMDTAAGSPAYLDGDDQKLQWGHDFSAMDTAV